MKKITKFDCVEFQRSVRIKHFDEANGDYELMLKNQKERLLKNSLWLHLLDRKEKQLENA